MRLTDKKKTFSDVEIQAAVEEEKPHTFKSCEAALRVCYKNAKAEAYEECAAKYAEGNRMAIQATYEDAAKIAEQYCVNRDACVDCRACKAAKAIRARAQELE